MRGTLYLIGNIVTVATALVTFGLVMSLTRRWARRVPGVVIFALGAGAAGLLALNPRGFRLASFFNHSPARIRRQLVEDWSPGCSGLSKPDSATRPSGWPFPWARMWSIAGTWTGVLCGRLQGPTQIVLAQNAVVQLLVLVLVLAAVSGIALSVVGPGVRRAAAVFTLGALLTFALSRQTDSHDAVSVQSQSTSIEK